MMAMLLNVAASRGLRPVKPHTLKPYAAELTIKDVAGLMLREDADDVVRAATIL